MLAQTFKTAQELRISERLHKALVEVYWMLVDESIPEHLFDMKNIGTLAIIQGDWCGTAGCLLGWAKAIDHKIVGFYQHGKIADLFYPYEGWAYKANRKQAAEVLHNYLVTGYVDWA